MSSSIQTTDQKIIDSLEKDLFQGQLNLPLEVKYQRLLKTYQNVTLERDLLKRAFKVYAKKP